MTRPNNSTLKNVALYAACFAFSVALLSHLQRRGMSTPLATTRFSPTISNTNTSTSSRGFAASF